MSVTFKNAPVVEIIAELRWGEAQIVIGGQGLDALFIRFGAEASKDGFTIFERGLPPGTPIGPYQAVYRYRNNDAPGRLLQLGNGVFTANATPPYQSWEQFTPVVRAGVERLFIALKDQPKELTLFDPEKGFSHGLLRYVNAFKSDLMNGQRPLAFINDVLGIKVELPIAMAQVFKDKDAIDPVMQFTTPIELGQISVSIGHGVVNNETALIYDITIALLNEIPADVDVIIDRFTQARQIIHDMFVGLTLPIQHLLQPEEA